MSTGIFKHNAFGQLEEVPQEDIEFWCSECQFPYGSKRCQEKRLIQKCWDKSEAIASKWHLQHECPFVHKGEKCHCNNFKTIEKAFKAAGLEYKPDGMSKKT